jgi:hypothetical protein
LWWQRTELLGFLARDFTGRKKVRYLNALGQQKSVYGLVGEADEVILFEGVFKALRAARVLPLPCCAVLGNRLSAGQITQLKEGAGVQKVYYWPDPDGPGIRGARESLKELQRAGIQVQLVWPPVYADEVGFEEIERTWGNRREFGIQESWNLRLQGGSQ